jgi:allantoinase
MNCVRTVARRCLRLQMFPWCRAEWTNFLNRTSQIFAYCVADSRRNRSAASGSRRTPSTTRHGSEELSHKAPAAKYSTWLASRPREAENEAIALMIKLATEFNARVHIVHVSSSDALPVLRAAKSSGLAITAETCPHYLTFASEEIPDGASEFKCAPPIRESENREKLWEALSGGTLDFVATDHSPCPPEMKRKDTGDFMAAWGGIASLELSLPAVWTSARQRGYAVERLAAWLCSSPARLAGLEKRKGKIAKDFDADLVIWDPTAKFRVEPERLHHRQKLTPYAGRELYGVVAATYLRGRKVFDRGEFETGPTGAILKRTQA